MMKIVFGQCCPTVMEYTVDLKLRLTQKKSFIRLWEALYNDYLPECNIPSCREFSKK